MLLKRIHAFLSYDDNNDCDDDNCNPGIANLIIDAVDDDEAHYDGVHHRHVMDRTTNSKALKFPVP